MLAALGMLEILLATRTGVGISPDSVSYIDGARSLLRGAGFSERFSGTPVPITHWPPLYSLLLAGTGLGGHDPISGARILSALLFGANVWLAGWLVLRHGEHAAWSAVLSSALVLTSAELMRIHTMAWSEPLFLLLAALLMHCITRYLRDHSRIWLIGAAVLAGLASVTRYPGVTLIAAGGVVVLSLGRQRWPRRLTDAAFFGIIGTGPLVLWIFRNLLLSGDTTNRQLVAHPIGLRQLGSGAATVSRWLLPRDIILPDVVRALIAAGAVAFTIYAWSRARTAMRKGIWSPDDGLSRVLIIFVIIYSAFLGASISLVDAATPLDSRLLSPVQYTLLVLAGLFAASMRFGRSEQRMLAAAALLILLLQGGQSVLWAADREQGAHVFTSRSWRESEMWRVIEGLPENVPIYTNAPDAVYFHTGRAAREIPRKWDPTSSRQEIRYVDHVEAMHRDLARSAGYLVYLRTVLWRDFLPSETELRQRLPLLEIHRTSDGSVYQVNHDRLNTAPELAR
jgi:hypothetical protein